MVRGGMGVLPGARLGGPGALPLLDWSAVWWPMSLPKGDPSGSLSWLVSALPPAMPAPPVCFTVFLQQKEWRGSGSAPLATPDAAALAPLLRRIFTYFNKDTCICDPKAIAAISRLSRSAAWDTVWSLIGLILMYLATIILCVRLTAGRALVRYQHTRQQQRTAAAAAGDGGAPGLPPPPGGEEGGSGGGGYIKAALSSSGEDGSGTALAAHGKAPLPGEGGSGGGDGANGPPLHP